MKDNIIIGGLVAFAIAVFLMFAGLVATLGHKYIEVVRYSQRMDAYEFCVAVAAKNGVQSPEVQCLNKF